MSESSKEREEAEASTSAAPSLEDELLAAGANLERALRIAIDREPIASMAVGAGIGFILGRGLPRGVTALMLGAGTRLAIFTLYRELMERGAADEVSEVGGDGP